MASLGVKIDPTKHDTDTQRGDYENLPDGTYRLEVETAEVKINGEGTQRKVGLNLTIQVIEPEEFKNKKIFNYINLEHPTAKAQEIGQAEFAKFCRAMGISDEVSDSDELLFKAFTADIGMGKPSKDTVDEKQADGSTKKVPKYPAKNEIKKFFYPDEGAVPTAKAEPVAANDNRQPPANDNKNAPAAASSGGKSRPWGAKK